MELTQTYKNLAHVSELVYLAVGNDINSGV